MAGYVSYILNTQSGRIRSQSGLAITVKSIVVYSGLGGDGTSIGGDEDDDDDDSDDNDDDTWCSLLSVAKLPCLPQLRLLSNDMI